MTYETAKKLKEAKFPFLWNYEPQALAFREYPSLSELIEACALKTLRLESWKEGWKAGDYLHQSIKKYALGKTPEEAVANLFLRLNDKK